ncbi:hypothetical protein FRC03_003297 [Tulasnella sp. 419]|nr:hypothetical protein FRC03_003297 [Tulasnella sp. 419]
MLMQSRQASFRPIESTTLVEFLCVNVGTVPIRIRIRNLHTNRWLKVDVNLTFNLHLP